MEVIFSNNTSHIGHIRPIIHKIDDFEIEINLDNTFLSIVEYVHIKKGKTIIVIDFIVDVSISTCGSTNVEFNECDCFAMQTNEKDDNEVLNMIKYAIKHMEQQEDLKDTEDLEDHESQEETFSYMTIEALGLIRKSLKDERSLDRFYTKKIDTSIKSIEYIRKFK